MTTRSDSKDRCKKYRRIYELFLEAPHIPENDITKIIGGNGYTTKNRVKEATEKGYVSYPQIRKRSYANTKEYVCFLRRKNAFQLFKQLITDDRFNYHAQITGFCDLWLKSREKIDMQPSLLEGYSSDCHISCAPHQSWDESIQKMKKKVKTFNKKEYIPKEILKTRWDEYVDWPPEYDTLFEYFKYSVRNPITPVMKEHHIPSDTIYQFLKDLPRLCTISVAYYPETIYAYDPFLYLIETEYEDFIIDLFSELPTTSLYFKVGDSLFILLYAKRELVRAVDNHEDLADLHIPLLIGELVDKDIITYESHGIIDYYWVKD